MKIVGIQKTTLLDFPDKIATTIFTLGCNIRCPYCHNKQISFDFAKQNIIDNNEVINTINERKNFIDGIVITGGEPTIQPELLNFMRMIKNKFGLLIKLDTNGTSPLVVRKAIDESLVDYVALDIKTSFENYKKYLNVDGQDILSTYNILRNSKVNYELRMTCYPEFIDSDGISNLINYLDVRDRIFIQKCNYESNTSNEDQLELFEELFSINGFNCASIRGVA